MWGRGLPCLKRPLVLWEFSARERPLVSRGLAWALSRGQSPGRSEPQPLSPKPECGGGDREGLGLEESVGAPGALGAPPPSFIPAHIPTRGHPCPEAAGGAGWGAVLWSSDLCPAESTPGPGAAVCPVPVCQAHGGPHRWGLEWFPEFCQLVSPGSGGTDPSGGRGFPWCPFSCPAHSP